MSVECPNCGSNSVDVLNTFRKTGTALGAASGVATGLGAATQSARLAALAISGGPVAMIGTAVISAITLGISGAVLGSECGQVLDENMTNNYRCLNCDHRFSLSNDNSI